MFPRNHNDVAFSGWLKHLLVNNERFFSCFLILNNFVFIIESQKSIVSEKARWCSFFWMTHTSYDEGCKSFLVVFFILNNFCFHNRHSKTIVCEKHDDAVFFGWLIHPMLKIYEFLAIFWLSTISVFIIRSQKSIVYEIAWWCSFFWLTHTSYDEDWKSFSVVFWF